MNMKKMLNGIRGEPPRRRAKCIKNEESHSQFSGNTRHLLRDWDWDWDCQPWIEEEEEEELREREYFSRLRI